MLEGRGQFSQGGHNGEGGMGNTAGTVSHPDNILIQGATTSVWSVSWTTYGLLPVTAYTSLPQVEFEAQGD